MKKSTQILLIEDNKHDQYFFVQALKEIESASLFHVANNGKEALHKLASSDTLPDLIFTDINMPVMDGIEYLSETVKMPLIMDIPVAVLSSDTTKMETLRDLGVRVFIEKPEDCNVLQKLVEYVLDMSFMTSETSTDSLGFQFIRSNYDIGTKQKQYR
jgi:CheY-like chemotaxis protein